MYAEPWGVGPYVTVAQPYVETFVEEPWYESSPQRQVSSTYVAVLQEPTFNSVHSAKGLLRIWLLAYVPGEQEVQQMLDRDHPSITQGSTFALFDGPQLVYAMVKRNSESYPLWKRLSPPAPSLWPRSAGTLSSPGTQRLLPAASPVWSGT